MKNKYDTLSEYHNERSFFLKSMVLIRIIRNVCIQKSLKAIRLSLPIPRQRIVNLAEYFILALSFLTVLALTLSTLSHKEMSMEEIFSNSALMSFVFILLSQKEFFWEMPIITSLAMAVGFLMKLKMSLLILAAILSGAAASMVFVVVLVKMHSWGENIKETNRT